MEADHPVRASPVEAFAGAGHVGAGHHIHLDRDAAGGEAGAGQAARAEPRGAALAEGAGDVICEALLHRAGQEAPALAEGGVGELVSEGSLDVVRVTREHDALVRGGPQAFGVGAGLGRVAVEARGVLDPDVEVLEGGIGEQPEELGLEFREEKLHLFCLGGVSREDAAAVEREHRRGRRCHAGEEEDAGDAGGREGEVFGEGCGLHPKKYPAPLGGGRSQFGACSVTGRARPALAALAARAGRRGAVSLSKWGSVGASC